MFVVDYGRKIAIFGLLLIGFVLAGDYDEDGPINICRIEMGLKEDVVKNFKWYKEIKDNTTACLTACVLQKQQYLHENKTFDHTKALEFFHFMKDIESMVPDYNVIKTAFEKCKHEGLNATEICTAAANIHLCLDKEWISNKVKMFMT